MLEHVPAWLGRALAGRRAGAEKLVCAQPGLSADAQLTLTSPAFADGGRLPERFTEDGEGVSPPLTWSGAPAAARLALIVEDPDAPTANPMVHAILIDLPAPDGRLEEGAMTPERSDAVMGKNSRFKQGWLPPDPPTGHGEHRYVFQLFAVDADAPAAGDAPGRAALIEALQGHVIASAVLTGTYSRGEASPAAPVGAAATA
jgi:Raf kinase inhibitor-like YbhB/YbcL family protein